jgi:GT2 family glycosyltransferase
MPDLAASSTLLSVSIVLYNNPFAQVEKTISSLLGAAQILLQSNPDRGINIQVVDHSEDAASREQMQVTLSGLVPESSIEFEFLESRGNQGFALGHNRVIRRAHSQFHLVLNPDVEVQAQALLRGIDFLQQHQDAVLVSPLVTDEQGRQQFLCKAYPSVLVLLLRAFAPLFVQTLFRRRLAHYELQNLCSGGEVVEVPLASGCFMLARTAALQSIGGFAEHYFLYFEDFDLSLRLARLGRVLFLPSMQIVHHGGYAARKGWRHIGLFMRSGWVFFRDNGWKWF